MFHGVLKKMKSDFSSPIKYYLDLDSDFVAMHQFIEQPITLKMLGYQCLNCKSSAPIYRQGFCKKCFFEAPSVGDWVIRPELSTAHLGKEDRDLEYEKKIQLQPHIVYLALSSHIKVGVTRKTQIPTRWIDQGAHEALAILETPNRYLAGVAEIALKEYFYDKTNWRKMLQNQAEPVSWDIEKKKAVDNIPDELKPYIISNNDAPLKLNFPLDYTPQKVKSLNLVEKQTYSGTLKGIKGQYLVFEDDTVFNIRSNEGLVIRLNID